MLELLEYDFFKNALFAAFLASVSCGIVGTYIVSKRMVFISGGISHASFGGIGLGYYLGINPIIGAAVFAVLAAIGIGFMTRKGEVREDSSIGILWSLGMAIGIIFVGMTPGYAPNLMSYLFGSILTVSFGDIWVMLGLDAVIILFFVLLFKEILYISFDEEFARTQNVPTDTIHYCLLVLISLTIVLNIRVVGIILVISLLTIPQATAGLFSKNFRSMIFLSVCFALISSISGLVVSYYLNIPSGATIIFSATILFGIAAIGKKICGMVKVKKRLGESM